MVDHAQMKLICFGNWHAIHFNRTSLGDLEGKLEFNLSGLVSFVLVKLHYPRNNSKCTLIADAEVVSFFKLGKGGKC